MSSRKQPPQSLPDAAPTLGRLDRSMSLVSQVEQILRKALADGHFPGNRLPTEMTLGEQLRVSRETVRRATEALRREGLLVKYRSRGTFISSARPNLRLASIASTLVGYIQIDFNDVSKRAIAGLMLQGASEEAGRSGLQLVVQHTADSQVGPVFEQLRQSVRLCGVIFTDGAKEKLLRRIAGLGLPLVLLDHEFHLPKINSVRDDSFEAARLAVQYLAELGHQRIAYAPWLRPDSNPWRLHGYRQGLRDAHLPRRRVLEIPVSLTEAGARHAVKNFLGLSPRPTALICFNNTLAGLVIEELRRRGVRVPEEVSVMGGGGEEISGLTCHQIDWFQMGRHAVRILASSLSAAGEPTPEHYLAPPVLRLGQTTGSRPAPTS